MKEIVKMLLLAAAMVTGFYVQAQPVYLVPPVPMVDLGWTASPTVAVTGYFLYEGTATGLYTKKIDCGNALTITEAPMIAGQATFYALTAYVASGQESALSTEISFTAPTVLPPTWKAPVLITLQASPDLENWGNIANVAVSHKYSGQFFRLAISPPGAKAPVLTASLHAAPVLTASLAPSKPL
jgi:hypothetical protein